MLKGGMGLAGILTMVLSTVTTTFLDVYSAGVSCVSISKKLNEKYVATAVCVIGTLLAVFTPIEQFEDFLYLIGSVFAPMIAVQITTYFIMKTNSENKKADFVSLAVWLVGFILYRVCMNFNTPLGCTFPVMAATVLICCMAKYAEKRTCGKFSQKKIF